MNSNLNTETNIPAEKYEEALAEVLSREIQRDSRRYSAEFEN